MFNFFSILKYISLTVCIAALIFCTIPGLSEAKEDHVVITDMVGRKVCIKKELRRIITGFKPATLCALSLGLAPKLVGVDTSSIQDKLAQSVYPKISNVTAIGSKTTGINFESLVALEPDLVVLYSQKDGIELANRLMRLNIPAIIIVPETFQTIKESLLLFANAAHQKHRIKKIESRMDHILSLVSTGLENMPQKSRLTAYFASANGLFSTATGNMLQHEIIEKAGLRNVAGGLNGYFQDISPEQLILWDPDIMILSGHIKKSRLQPLKHKTLQQVSAVSQKKVFLCPSTIAPWDFPSPLSVLATLWAASTAYPERFKHLDIMKEADEFHQILFNKTMTRMGGELGDEIHYE